jgi:hypothetical protein
MINKYNNSLDDMIIIIIRILDLDARYASNEVCMYFVITLKIYYYY